MCHGLINDFLVGESAGKSLPSNQRAFPLRCPSASRPHTEAETLRLAVVEMVQSGLLQFHVRRAVRRAGRQQGDWCLGPPSNWD